MQLHPSSISPLQLLSIPSPQVSLAAGAPGTHAATVPPLHALTVR
jgi:hypothetical protein